MSFLSRTFLGAYGALWRAAKPLLGRHTRLREGFAERLVPEGWPFSAAGAQSVLPHPAGSSGKTIWIQAASGGEARLALALADALADALAARLSAGSAWERRTLICTTCTRQGLDVLEKGLMEREKSFDSSGFSFLPRYFPLDVPALMREAVRRARPSAVVLLETELWPGLLAAVKEEGVPVFLCNGRMTEKSLTWYRRLKGFWKGHAPARVLAVSAEDAGRFAELFGADRVGVMPNMKFDSLSGTDPASSLHFVSASFGSFPCFALASVREEEEEVLMTAAKALLGARPCGLPPVVVVAPRHMHRVSYWEKRLAAEGIAFARRSDGALPRAMTAPHGPRLLLWDTFGELDTLYASADAVFVGGSLAPLGGQNFLEPLAHGCIPCIGPHWKNFHWVGQELFDQGLALRVAVPSEVAPALLALAEARLTCSGPGPGVSVTDDAAEPAPDRQAGLAPDHMTEPAPDRAAEPAPGGAPEPASERAAGLAPGGAFGLAIQDARARHAEDVRRRFAAWLAPRAGGVRQAADALLRMMGEGAGEGK